PPRPTLFPYTTLFRSSVVLAESGGRLRQAKHRRDHGAVHQGHCAVDAPDIKRRDGKQPAGDGWTGDASEIHRSVVQSHRAAELGDRKSTRLNSSHVSI